MRSSSTLAPILFASASRRSDGGGSRPVVAAATDSTLFERFGSTPRVLLALRHRR